MAEQFDVVVVGAGSAGAVIAARLSEDPSVRVALLEAGGPPPPEELMPAAVAALQLNPETDWMYTGDAGGCGRGLAEGRMMVPRGRMLGGSSGINYMAYVRGHPGDFDAWAAGGAQGWAYDDVLPYFKKSEGFQPSDDIVVDADAHSPDGPLGVSVRAPVIPAARQFVEAAEGRGDPDRRLQRARPRAARGRRLALPDHDQGRQALLDLPRLPRAGHGRAGRTSSSSRTHACSASCWRTPPTGSWRPASSTARRDGALETVTATKEVVLSAGAIGSPQLLLLSGVGPEDELAQVGVACRLDLPDVGKHLKDHLHAPMFFEAPGIGLNMTEVAISLGPDALRAPAGPLPADPADDAGLPPELAGLKAEAERRLTEWVTTGRSLVSSSLYDAGALVLHRPGRRAHPRRADRVPRLRLHPRHLADRVPDRPRRVLRRRREATGPRRGGRRAAPQPGAAALRGRGPPGLLRPGRAAGHLAELLRRPARRDGHGGGHAPGAGAGRQLAGPGDGAAAGAAEAGRVARPLAGGRAERRPARGPGAALRADRLPRDVDLPDGQRRRPDLRVTGVDRLRVADASVMPNVTSGNTNAPTIMIGEKAAELIAADHGMRLAETVGPGPRR